MQETNSTRDYQKDRVENTIDLVNDISDDELSLKEEWYPRIMIFLLGILLLISGYMFYRYAPLTVVLQGEWASSDDSTYRLSVVKDEFILTNKTVATQDYYRTISWRVRPSGINKFKSEEVQVSLVITKDFFTEDQLKQIRDNSAYYRVLFENNNELILSYKDELIKQTFGVHDLNRLLSVKIVPQGLTDKSVLLQNSSFLENGLLLKRD